MLVSLHPFHFFWKASQSNKMASSLISFLPSTNSRLQQVMASRGTSTQCGTEGSLPENKPWGIQGFKKENLGQSSFRPATEMPPPAPQEIAGENPRFFQKSQGFMVANPWRRPAVCWWALLVGNSDWWSIYRPEFPLGHSASNLWWLIMKWEEFNELHGNYKCFWFFDSLRIMGSQTGDLEIPAAIQSQSPLCWRVRHDS